jgi:hypothetical protein
VCTKVAKLVLCCIVLFLYPDEVPCRPKQWKCTVQYMSISKEGIVHFVAFGVVRVQLCCAEQDWLRLRGIMLVQHTGNCTVFYFQQVDKSDLTSVWILCYINSNNTGLLWFSVNKMLSFFNINTVMCCTLPTLSSYSQCMSVKNDWFWHSGMLTLCSGVDTRLL